MNELEKAVFESSETEQKLRREFYQVSEERKNAVKRWLQTLKPGDLVGINHYSGPARVCSIDKDKVTVKQRDEEEPKVLDDDAFPWTKEVAAVYELRCRQEVVRDRLYLHAYATPLNSDKLSRIEAILAE